MDWYTDTCLFTKLYRRQDQAQCTCDSAFLKLSVRAREMLLSPKASSCDPCLGPAATLPPLINQCTCKYICSISFTRKYVEYVCSIFTEIERIVTLGGEERGVEGRGGILLQAVEAPTSFLSCPVGNAHVMTTS